MSRALRIEYKNAYYHIMNQGYGRQRIFHGQAYYEAFLETLLEAHQRYGLQVHAYCLMNNNYHMLVSTPEANLSRAMRHVNGLYTQRYQQLRGADGAIFRGRYRAILIDAKNYLTRVSKYIHRLPLDTKKVKNLQEYSWSSYGKFSARRKKQEWLCCEEILEYFPGNKPGSLYNKFLLEPNDEEISRFYNRRRLASVLGDEVFKKQMAARRIQISNDDYSFKRPSSRPSINQVINKTAQIHQVNKSHIVKSVKGRREMNIPRLMAMKLCKEITGSRLIDIADYFHLNHYGSVSNGISRLEKMLDEDKAMTTIYRKINNHFGY